MPGRNKKTKLPKEVLRAGKKAGRRASRILGEFKEFISRGNVTDMAMGVIVGSAFTAIARSFADDVLMPLMGTLMGGIDLTDLSFTVKSLFFSDYSVTVAYGRFLQAIVGFFIIAVSVFFMVKMLNVIRRRNAVEEPSEPEEHILLLSEIRDLLKGGISVTMEEGEQLSLFTDEDSNEPDSAKPEESPATVLDSGVAPSENKSND